MGVLPLQFKPGESAASLNLTGLESYDLTGIASGLSAGCDIPVRATSRGRRADQCSP